MPSEFSYSDAFSRNLGWLTEPEQKKLRGSRVAIAGLGGVGGIHLLTLARLGVGSFNLSDFDTFDLANFNRQAGALMSTLGQPKLETLANMALDINPELKITPFPQGVTDENVDAFLDGVDLYLDGLDFFVLKLRRRVFMHCHEHGIPAVTAAPLGMGAAVLNFLPGGMSFDEYFQFREDDEMDIAVRFLLGLTPARLQFSYLVDPGQVNLQEKRGPSTVMACQLCAGVAATEALKILLGRGPVRAAPKGYHFDAYRNKLALTWRPGGNRNPLQRLAIAIARHRLGLA
jgi:molybdopterin/thiamine biosynthesis adenylyltransferase